MRWRIVPCLLNAAALGSIVANIGCSGGSSSALGSSDAGSTSSGSASAAQACADTASAYCTELGNCSQIAISVDYGDMNTCVSRRTTLCQNGLMAPGTGTTPSTIEACVAAYSTWSCADFMNGVPPTACQPQAGTGAQDAPCAFDAQCTSKFCDIPYGGECGKCAQPPAAGSSCVDLSHCPSGLFCTKNTKVCTTHAMAGQSCDDDTTCGYGLSCVNYDATTGAAGTCMTAVAEAGAPCDHAQKTDAGCASVQDLYCAKNDTCEAYSTASSSQPCKFVGDAGTYTYCLAGATCLVVPSTAQTGTCTGPASDNQPCNSAAGDSCQAPATCVGTPVDGGVSGTCMIASASSCAANDP